MAGFLGRLRPVVTARSVAREVFALHLALVLVLVLAAAAALVLQARADAEREARDRALAVAWAFARAPGLEEALAAPDPSAVLQPRTESARRVARVDFIVVMTPEGIRHTHPDPALIGRRHGGTIAPAAAGGTVRETVNGTLGPSTRAVVPVVSVGEGTVVGLVAAGITLEGVADTADGHLPLLLAATAAALLLSLLGAALVGRRLRRQTRGLEPAEITRMYEHHHAVLHAVREGVLIVAADGRLALVNDEARRLLDLPPDAEGRTPEALGIDEDLARLLAGGRTVTDEVHVANGRVLAVNQRPTARDGEPSGSVATLRDTTELRALSGRADAAREHLSLLYDAGARIGSRLDVPHTARELADLAVPRFADAVAVDLPEAVLRGEEPPEDDLPPLRRVAVRGGADGMPFPSAGEPIAVSPTTPQGIAYRSGDSFLQRDTAAHSARQAPEQPLAPGGDVARAHSVLAVPLRARGTVLGVVTFWRSRTTEPFGYEDESLAEELVARAAVSIDNARRYAREHALAAGLRRSLLPRTLPAQNAVEVAHRHLPAPAGRSGAGGDWYDVVPLPGARVALVMGHVMGHGLHAAATLGRLRTAVHTFAALDLPPEELLWRLDELVSRIDREHDGTGEPARVTGASCLYVVHDPWSGRCTLARAGHPRPVLLAPDGRADLVDVPDAPPLGLGGLPMGTASLLLSPGSTLVLPGHGLLGESDGEGEGSGEGEGNGDGSGEGGSDGSGERWTLLRQTVGRAGAGAGAGAEAVCEAVWEALLPERSRDDMALLVARTRAPDRRRVACWDVPHEPAAVSGARAAVLRTLAEWGLSAQASVTELIVGELLANAVRHASPPVRVRLIRDRALICEVSDGSSTFPHLRRATGTDEGGRGLFLVARLADRWGTRCTPGGKVVWAERSLPLGRD
ncbi:SpoIIE family protein phosphatase [Streptomyces sp. NPDC029526]|uniref:SpoIIE family protein phosphatase n=1 Tax=Streptomyces sp. NPDC029526 TaxID=3155728 RepID=UPI0034018151